MKMFFLLFLWSSLAVAQEQPSAVEKVFSAITADVDQVKQPAQKYLQGHAWEALAYWDMSTPKEKANMFEAVGDIYKFNADSTFNLKMIDPQNTQKFGLEIAGTYLLKGQELTLISKSKKEQKWKIVMLDENYLIFEIDGLRIFFTQNKSFYTYD